MEEEREEEKGVARRRRVCLTKTKWKARSPNSGGTSARCNRETILDSVRAETRVWKPLGAPWRPARLGRFGRQARQAGRTRRQRERVAWTSVGMAGIDPANVAAG